MCGGTVWVCVCSCCVGKWWVCSAFVTLRSVCGTCFTLHWVLVSLLSYCARILTFTCMHTHLYTCTYKCMITTHTYIYAHTYTHTHTHLQSTFASKQVEILDCRNKIVLLEEQIKVAQLDSDRALIIRMKKVKILTVNYFPLNWGFSSPISFHYHSTLPMLHSFFFSFLLLTLHFDTSYQLTFQLMSSLFINTAVT